MFPFIFYISLFLPATVLGKDYFTAAVFEHRPQYDNDSGKEPFEIKSANLRFYRKAAEVAGQKGVDIMVFNEYGIFVYPFTRENFMRMAEHVPDPRKHKFNPCTENAKDRLGLYTASCIAREHNMYVVVNIADVQPCDAACDADKIDSCATKCPDDGVHFYNADVAFDREGNIIARYHKVHPYFELVHTPEGPEFVTFKTDFGKFGMIVCFDAVFEESTLLSEDYGIDTLLFPTYWFDDIVPLNSVEFQQSWAIANGINFLAANTHAPGTASLGSGIYSKTDGALVYTYEPDGKSKLLVANIRIRGNSEIPNISSITVITPDDAIPKIETGEKFPEQSYDKLVGPPLNKYEDYRSIKPMLENYTLAKLEKLSGDVQACDNGFCCSLSYSTQEMQDEFYLAAFNGLNNVRGYFKFWEESCLLVRCDPFEGKPCLLQPSNSKTIFQRVDLKGNFQSKKIFPAASKNKFRLAPREEWNLRQNGAETILTFQSDSDIPLLKVALYGRSYDRDPPFVPFFQY